MEGASHSTCGVSFDGHAKKWMLGSRLRQILAVCGNEHDKKRQWWQR
jgi:hypothetical protein